MFRHRKNITYFILLACLLCLACEKDMEVQKNGFEHTGEALKTVLTKTPAEPGEDLVSFLFTGNKKILAENLRDNILPAIKTEECAPTELETVVFKHLTPIAEDSLAVNNYTLYTNLNFYIASFDTSEQYFGPDGEYTNLIKRRQRELERFWQMPDRIQVHGQHTDNLNDREKLANIFMKLGMDDYSREMAYAAADEVLRINQQSPNLPHSPLFAADGFITYNGLIVIGDGLVQLISETGIDPEIVWTGILAHEWSHQIQMDHRKEWYPKDPVERVWYNELEADFFASYYMTHKRGATYNWKKVDRFFDLFFQLGGCGIDINDPHGTPFQRLEAAKMGYELASNAHKKGHILGPEELHHFFLSELHRLEKEKTFSASIE